MIRLLASVAVFGAGLLVAQALAVHAQAPRRPAGLVTNDQPTMTVARVDLKALDTLNGSTTELSLNVGETVRFGRLEVTADACRIPADDPKGDAEAFLRIRDTREEGPRFTGWMFASSPALSALDHPRYDVWVVGCENG